MPYTRDDLEEVIEKAWSYEARAGWDAEELDTEFIGTVQRGKRLYDLYVDTAGNYWYTVRIITEKEVLTEYEAIFGHKPRKRYRRKWNENDCGNVAKGRNCENHDSGGDCVHTRRRA